jgi:capsule polysaccharide export protein KpsE/RkpR
MIDPPVAEDPRVSVAVNPTYLESLRSYEMVASSDTLFARALEKFHLRDTFGGTPLESIKRHVLKVSKVRDTKVMEISATLADPKQAQGLAQFVAEEAVNLSRASNRASEQEMLESAQRQLDEARTSVERQQSAWLEFSAREPLDGARAELDALTSLRKTLRQDLAEARTELAEFKGRDGDARTAEVRGRMESIEKQDAELGRQIDAEAASFSKREARSEQLELSLRNVQEVYRAANSHLGNVRASLGMRGDRLHVIDPGVVPERPSSPHVFLNVALAMLVALAASITYLTLTFRPDRP